MKNYTDQLGDKAQAAVDDIDAQLDVIQDRVDQMTQYAGQDTQELHATTLSMIQCLDTVRQAIYDLGKGRRSPSPTSPTSPRGPASSPGAPSPAPSTATPMWAASRVLSRRSWGMTRRRRWSWMT